MRLLISSVLILVGFAGSLSAARCRCQPPAPGETTRSGANESIVSFEKRKHSQLAGIVHDVNGQIISDVLVEVFDKPDQLLLPSPRNVAKQKPRRNLRLVWWAMTATFAWRTFLQENTRCASARTAAGIISRWSSSSRLEVEQRRSATFRSRCKSAPECCDEANP
jgi:hypothetical protein